MRERVVFRRDAVLGFAAMSGDWNPMHVDPEVARREVYGRTVVHGVLVFLQMLDRLLGNQDKASISSIHVRFLQPVYLDTSYDLEWVGQPHEKAIGTLWAGETRVLTAQVRLSHAHDCDCTLPQQPDVDCREPVAAKPDDDAVGKLALWLDAKAAGALFPNLVRVFPHVQIAWLGSLSRLVGMVCPGKRSVFSQFEVTAVDAGVKSVCQYEKKRYDPRFGLVELAVSGAGLQGKVRAFWRPEPARQIAYETVCRAMTLRVRKPMRAVVLGGSRGIGEVTAKMLAAAGAEVLLTYRSGKAEADAILAEIRAGGGKAETVQYDVEGGELPQQWTDADLLFYFVTPPVFQARRGPFDDALFNQFKVCYVDAFLRIVEACPQATIFYPSTVAIDEKVASMVEYAKAKELGEAACRELVERDGRKVVVERLPRTRTDQTQTVGMQVPAADAFDVMLTIVEKLVGSRLRYYGGHAAGLNHEGTKTLSC